MQSYGDIFKIQEDLGKANDYMSKLQEKIVQLEEKMEEFKKGAKPYSDNNLTLEQAIDVLTAAKEKEENIYVNCFGKRLYSFDTKADCIKKVTNGKLTEDEFDKIMKITRDSFRGKIDEFVNRAKQYIYPQRVESLKSALINDSKKGYGVDHSLGMSSAYSFISDYDTAVIDNALDIMKKLDAGCTAEEAINSCKFKDENSTKRSRVFGYILNFSKRGPEVYKAYKGEKMSDFAAGEVKRIEEQNKQYEAELANNAELEQAQKGE